MPTKLPIADFKTQAEWHSYLDMLKPAQLKKVSSALNKILRKEFKLDTKKPATELLADVKKLYSVNNATKLLEIVKGIPAEDLPQPSQNLPKPTAKQRKEAEALEKARQAEEKRIETERKRIEERKAKSGEDDLIDNWSVVNPSLFDLYSYDKYKEIKPDIIERFVMSKSMVKGKPNTFAINFLASKLPKSVIDEVYNKYGLKKLLLGLTYITATILDRDHPMMFDEASLPGAKLNKEYQTFIKPMIESKNNVGYDKIIKYLK